MLVLPSESSTHYQQSSQNRQAGIYYLAGGIRQLWAKVAHVKLRNSLLLPTLACQVLTPRKSIAWIANQELRFPKSSSNRHRYLEDMLTLRNSRRRIMYTLRADRARSQVVFLHIHGFEPSHKFLECYH